MRFRSLDCDGADEGARNSASRMGCAALSRHFDCPNADAPRSNDEFSLGPSTL